MIEYLYFYHMAVNPRGSWPKPAVSSFGARMKELRVARGISQVELARRIGRHQTAIGPYERNEYAPPRDIVERLAEVLETTPEFLVFGRQVAQAGLALIGHIGPGGVLAREESIRDQRIPPLAVGRLAATLVEDDTMAPVLRRGQIALVAMTAEPDADRLLGREVLAELGDGRALLRRLLPAAEAGSYDLAAHAAPTLRGVRLAGARAVLGVLWPAALGESNEAHRVQPLAI